MSGIPFNPMRREPPPPPHIDTVSFHPTEYVRLRSREGQEFFVHCECLRESPFLRRAFAKGQDITHEYLTISFTGGRPLSTDGVHAAEGTSAASEQAAGDDAGTDGALDLQAAGSTHQDSHPHSGKGGLRSASLPFEAALAEAVSSPTAAARAALAGDGGIGTLEAILAARKAMAPPLVLTETLQLNQSVSICFPKTSAAVLDTVVSYLYYKHRYDRRTTEPRPPFTMPLGSTIDVMLLAHLLEC